MPAILTRERALLRFRCWVNGRKTLDLPLTSEEASRGVDVVESLLKPLDRYVICLEDMTGQVDPWFHGNDLDLARRVCQGDYGLKLPEGELSWQARHGAPARPPTRIAPPRI